MKLRGLNVYVIVGLVSLAGLIALILYGPGQQSDKTEAHLWNRNWAIIEFAPSAGPAKYRFIRDAGLFADRFYFQQPGGPRFTGNYNVKNSFTDWQKPQIKALYEATPERLQQTELDRPGPEIRFYAAPDDEPVIFRVGKRTSGGTVFMYSADPDFAGALYGLQVFLADKFNQEPMQYRERRFIDAVGEDYLASIEVRAFQEGRRDILELRQGRVPGESPAQTPGLPQTAPAAPPLPQPFWERRGVAGWTPIPTPVASQVDSAVRQLQIARFADEDLPPLRSDLEAEWRLAGQDLISLRVRSRDGATAGLQVRRPPAFAAQDAEFLLVRSELAEGLHWVRADSVHTLIQAARAALASAPQAAAGQGP